MTSTLAAQFEALWNDGQIPDPFAFLATQEDATLRERTAVFLVDQLNRHRSGTARSLEEYLAAAPDIAADQERTLELIVAEYRHLSSRGQAPDRHDFAGRFPDHSDSLLDLLVSAEGSLPSADDETVLTNEWGDGEQDGEPRGEGDHEEGGGEYDRIGRYRAVRVLGAGGFGKVLLARDEELNRNVAIKVPHPHRVETDAARDEYLSEARMLASLDHPNIVPVYDVGRTDSGLCYIVSKLIEGNTLANLVAWALLF